MLVLRSRAALTMGERAAKHRLLVRDTLALTTLLSIAVALSFVTYMLFRSFADHRLVLEQRWKKRGEAALANGKPVLAINSLRSALAYAPDERGLQIELATALAAAGRTQEATVYFDTLHEAAPGDGMINLQLARLAARQGNVPLAVTNYEAALDGTWNGDGVLRRRQVRLELSRYLIAQQRFEEARNQILIAAGNAADNHSLQLTAASLLEQAQADGDAFTLYRKAIAFRETRTAALVGAGRTAAAQSRYLLARNMLEQAAAQPDFAHLPESERAAVRQLLDQARDILAILPAENLSPHIRAVRVAHAAQVARARLSACMAQQPSQAGSGPAASSDNTASPQSPAMPNQPGGALRSALGAVQRARETLAGASSFPAPTPPSKAAGANPLLSSLALQWQKLPPAGEHQMERDPAALNRTLELVYETEKTTAQLCGNPRGEDALLLKIAAAPDEIGQP